MIDFREGNAEALPFPDEAFDVTFSITALEELNADQALREMTRVTKPGGRIGVIVRAIDVPRWFNLSLREELKAAIERPLGPSGQVSEGGCADASLYSRFLACGLTNVTMFPQLYTDPPIKEVGAEIGFVENRLKPEDRAEFWEAVGQATQQGTMFVQW